MLEEILQANQAPSEPNTGDNTEISGILMAVKIIEIKEGGKVCPNPAKAPIQVISIQFNISE